MIDGIRSSPGKRSEVFLGGGKWCAENNSVDVLQIVSSISPMRDPPETYTTLENTESSLKNIHDGVVNALLVVDDLVVVDSSNDKDGTVVGAFAFPLIHRLLRVPAVLPCQLLLGLCHHAQELDVPAREKIEAAVDVGETAVLGGLLGAGAARHGR